MSVRAFSSVEDWWRDHREHTSDIGSSIDRAVAGGERADRLGTAFAAGYQEALSTIRQGARALCCLCATESGGAHPRAIQTKLEAERLNGKKTFATLGLAAERLLIVANRGTKADGRPELVVADLDADREGISRSPLPQTPFIPEIGHAEIALENVRVESTDVLAGDGYLTVLKPFRTIEDIHVMASCLAYLSEAALRYQLERSLVEGAMAQVAALRTLATEDPSNARAHLALSGVLRSTQRLVDRLSNIEVEGPEMKRIVRDLPLFSVAASAREKRGEKAWATLAKPPRSPF